MTYKEYRKTGHDLIDGLLPENVRAVVEFAMHLGAKEDADERREFESDTRLHAELDRARQEFERGETTPLREAVGSSNGTAGRRRTA